MSAENYLGKLLIGKTAQGQIQFVGRCISYCDAPTVGVITPDGTHAHWRADLCEIVEMPEEAVKMLKLEAGNGD